MIKYFKEEYSPQHPSLFEGEKNLNFPLENHLLDNCYLPFKS